MEAPTPIINTFNLLMKNSLLIFFAFLLLSFYLADNNKTDFSGTWQLNISESVFGDFPKTNSTQRYLIVQQNEKISVQRSLIDSTGVLKEYTELYHFDSAKLSKVIRSYDGVIKFSRFKWNSEREFVVSSEYRLPSDSNRTVQKSFETWQLSGDGKRCIISSQIQTTQKVMNVVWVLDKEK